MIRVFLQLVTGFVLLASMVGAPAIAQNLFITPNNKDKSASDKAEKALPGIVVKPRVRSRFDDVRGTPKKRKVYKRKVQKRNPDFDIFKKVKGLDLDLMRAGGREPQTQEELRLVSAAYSMPQVSGMLEMKRKIESDLAKKMVKANKKNARTDYLKSVVAKNKRAKAAKTVAPKDISGNRSPKIFNNYR